MDLNGTLDEYEKPVAIWLEAVRKELAAVSKLQKAVREGNLRDLERQRSAAQTATANVIEAARNCTALDFDTTDYLTPDGAFFTELKIAAEKAGVNLFERDGVIFSYPVLVRPEPDLAGVRVDKKLIFTLRPLVLASLLKRLQASDTKARPERFIEVLFSAYELLHGGTYVDIPLTNLYAVLTLLPGSDKEYTLLDFTREIYFLDISGTVETRKGFMVSFPASTTTREKRVKPLPFVDRQGREKLYATIKFTPPTGEEK